MEEFRLDGLTVKEHLLILAEDGNRKFTEGLHPGVEHVLGIRLPAFINMKTPNKWMEIFQFFLSLFHILNLAI